jgi:hypothetical protein
MQTTNATNALASRKACDLTPDELINSPLARRAVKAGYASLTAMLNDHRMWGESVEHVEEFLREQESDTKSTGSHAQQKTMTAAEFDAHVRSLTVATTSNARAEGRTP